MTLSGRDVLLVGQNFHSAQALTCRLDRWGFRCDFVRNLSYSSAEIAAEHGHSRKHRLP